MHTLLSIPFLLRSGIAILGGLAFILIGGLIASDSYQTFSLGVKTVGTVVKVVSIVETKKKKVKGREKEYQIEIFHPVIRFSKRNGKTQTLQSKNGSSSLDLKVGDMVNVFYIPNKEKYFKIDLGFWSNYLGAIVFFGLGLLALMAGIYNARLLLNFRN